MLGVRGIEQHRIYRRKHPNSTNWKRTEPGTVGFECRSKHLLHRPDRTRGEESNDKNLEKIALALEVTLLDLLLHSNPKKGVRIQSMQILTPARIKQCLLEVLIEHTDLVTLNVLKSYRHFEE